MKLIKLAIGCCVLAGTALAQGQPANQVMPGNQGSLPPGGLSASDVSGKWLLDANGRTIGRIAGVNATGGAMVRTDDGRKLVVPMRKLSLGNGPNTVIESGDSEADQLNRIELGGGPRNR